MKEKGTNLLTILPQSLETFINRALGGGKIIKAHLTHPTTNLW